MPEANDADAHRPTVGESLQAVMLCLLLLLALAFRVQPITPDHPAYAQGGDHVHYTAMYARPGEGHPPPFCYRVLAPTLARVLPMPEVPSFYAVAFLSLLAAGVLMYRFLRRRGGGHFFAMLGATLFYSLNWISKFLVHDFWLADALLYALVMLAVLALESRRYAWLSVAMCLGTLAKESALFLVPLVYGWLSRRVWDRRALALTAAVTAAPIAAYALLRWMVPSSVPYEPWNLMREVGGARVTEGLGSFVRGGTVGAWGVAVLALATIELRWSWRFVARSAGFLALVHAQPLFAKNVDRLLVLAFPVMIVLAVDGLRRVSQRFGLRAWETLGFAAVPYALLFERSGWLPAAPEKELLFLALWVLVVAASHRIARHRAT